MNIGRVAVFGTGESAKFSIAFCESNGIEVAFIVDDFRTGHFNDKQVISWEAFLVAQFDLDALIIGRWQNGGIEKRAGITIPVIVTDEKALQNYKHSYDQKNNMKRLAENKDKHAGERCFIIGNGPSLKMGDLDKLKNEITFASNKIFLAYEETDWRPTYYCIEDYLVASQNRNILDNIHSEIFIEKTTLDFLNSSEAMVFEFRHDGTKDGFSKDVTHGLMHGYSIVCSQMQIAYYMGIKEIYLLGVDFSFVYNEKEASSVFHNIQCYEYNNDVNHFTDKYRVKGELWTHPDLEKQYGFFSYVQRNVVGDGFKIYNASRQTKLDVFPRVNFDSLF